MTKTRFLRERKSYTWTFGDLLVRFVEAKRKGETANANAIMKSVEVLTKNYGELLDNVEDEE